MIKQIKAALVAISRKGIDELQAGARSAQGTSLNYASVNTLDPSRLARAFQAADQGIITDQAALFEMVEEQDSHIFSELAKRRRSVTGLGWQLTPPDDATEAELGRCVELADMLAKIPKFEDAQYNLTDAIGKGIAPLEIDWKTGSEWVPKALLWVPQRMFQVDQKTGELQFLKMGIPEPLRPWGWVVHEHQAKSGYIESAALFRVLAWTYAYKAYNIRDMQRFLEVYGLPLRLGKFPPGIGDKAKSELLRAVRSIGNDGAGIVPSNMTIDFVQAMKTGEVNDFLNAVTYWERKQSMAILGGTLTSQADGKSSTNALGAIHDKIRREIMLHDVRQIEPTISDQLVKPIALINGMFPENRLPKFTYLTEETVDQDKMADVLTKASKLGMEIDVEWAHKVMQIPRAKEGAKLLGASSANSTQTAATLARMAVLAAGPQAGDVTGAYAAQLAALCAPHEQALIQQVAAIVAEAGDFEAALAGIEALKSNNPKWAESIALGMAAAHLAGRSDVQDEGDEK